MKKRFRAMLCVAALALLLCTSAMAAGPTDLNIAYNGAPLTFTDAVPQIVNNRTYLPFRAVFTALGFADENITFANDTRTVSAVGEDLEVSMVIGENKVTIVKDGKTTVLDTDVPAFIDPAVNRTFVPVSFVAQAVGYRVAWNGETRTVFIDDVEGILAANTQTYQILEKYLAYCQAFQKKNYKVEGTFAATMDAAEDAMSMAGTYSMRMAGSSKFDLSMRMNLSGLTEGTDLSDAIPEGIDLAMCGDMTSGDIYFKSDRLMTQMGNGTENLWFKVKRGTMMGSSAETRGMFYMDMLDMSQIAQGVRGKDLVENRISALAQSDPTRSVVDQLAMYNALFGDSAFEKKSGDYVNAFEEDGTKMTVVFHTSGNRINGYSVTMSTVEDGISVSVEQSMKEKTMHTVYRVQEDGTNMTMEMDGICTAAKNGPVGAPGKEEMVLELTAPLFPAA